MKSIEIYSTSGKKIGCFKERKCLRYNEACPNNCLRSLGGYAGDDCSIRSDKLSRWWWPF